MAVVSGTVMAVKTLAKMLMKKMSKKAIKKAVVKGVKKKAKSKIKDKLMGKGKKDKRQTAKNIMQQAGEFPGGGALAVSPTTALIPKSESKGGALATIDKSGGGGDGSLSSFANFCGSYQWLVWIFILDSDTNFLLANNAGGRMPRHLTFEPGFEDISAITDGSPEGSSSALGKRIASAEDDLVEAKKHREGISSMLSLIKNKLTSSTRAHGKRMSVSTLTSTPEKLSRLTKKLTTCQKRK